jgi:serine/threonine protein kinase
MNLKIFQYLYLLIIFFASTTPLTNQDLKDLIKEYNAKSVNFDEDLRNFPKKLFTLWSKSSMIKRVKNFQKILGSGTGGFAFLAHYLPPNNQNEEWIPAAIKILPDNADFEGFTNNLIQAKLTGNLSEDKFTPKRMSPFSFDQTENRAQINNDGVENEFKDGICKFYEMQTKGFRINRKDYFLTTLITEAGVSDMEGRLFSNPELKRTNTITFLRYIKEFAKGAMNINKQGILHGDIKPANAILVKGDDDLLHPKHIDFDICLDTNRGGDEPAFADFQLRYTPGFRAPWVVAVEINTQIDPEKEPDFEEYYNYDSDFKEDAYAVGVSILDLYNVNRRSLSLIKDNEILKALLIYIRENVIENAKQGANFVPTTEEIYDYIKGLEENGVQEVGNGQLGRNSVGILNTEQTSDEGKTVERKHRKLTLREFGGYDFFEKNRKKILNKIKLFDLNNKINGKIIFL